MTENDVLGFDPQDLFRQEENTQQTSQGNPNIYRMRPADSISEDHVYRATIKVVYNPFDRIKSFLDQQAYALEDANGFFTVISSLTDGDKNCPVFKAWKKCHFAKKEDNFNLWKQAAKEEEGGKALFDKRQARYCVIQVLSDKNKPELEGSFKLWKIPASIYDIIKQKQDPSEESGKAAIPVMDYLFGRSIDVEVTPGPGKPGDVTYTRQVKYSGEISEDVVSCVNPDGSDLLTSDEQDVLDTYVSAMKKIWKSKNADERKEFTATVNADPNTAELRKIYLRVFEQIKEWAPNLDTLGYHEWSDEVKVRVQNWIDIVLQGNTPKEVGGIPAAAATVGTTTATATETTSTAAIETADDPDSDLPF